MTHPPIFCVGAFLLLGFLSVLRFFPVFFGDKVCGDFFEGGFFLGADVCFLFGDDPPCNYNLLYWIGVED